MTTKLIQTESRQLYVAGYDPEAPVGVSGPTSVVQRLQLAANAP